MKNKGTIIVMAIICFLIMPYACSKGLSNLSRNWETVESIKDTIIPIIPTIFSSYIAKIDIETVQQGFNWFLMGVRGLGFATMAYCVSMREYGCGFAISALADGMSIIIRISNGYNLSFDRNQLIVLGIPFAMWLCCMIIGVIVKGKPRIFSIAIVAALIYWAIYCYIYNQLYFNVNIAILGSMLLLGSLAMEQMNM